MTDRVRVLVSIDTEEDEWGRYDPARARVENIQMLNELRGLWDRFGVQATYFVNYAPLASPEAASVLSNLLRETPCEMGVHCHPWNTPPLGDGHRSSVSMMSDLSREENYEKLATLTELYQERFGSAPVSFRAGRWGFGPSVAEPLGDLGYKVDSSVSPFVDWTSFGGPDYSRAPQNPYRFHASDPLSPSADGPLVEVPTSVGFLMGRQPVAASLRTWLERSRFRHFKVVGALDLSGLLARRWLSPENSSERDMVRLARALVRSGQRVLDLTFHSSSLLPGATPFVRNQREKERFLVRIEEFLCYCRDEGFEFSTVGKVGESILG